MPRRAIKSTSSASGSSSIKTGRIGEFIAAAALERLGCVAVTTTVEGFDIAAYHIELRSWFRVEVKSRLKCEQNSFQFMTSKGAKRDYYTTADCDFFALVAVPLRMVIFEPVAGGVNKTMRVDANAFTIERETQSFKEAINLATQYREIHADL